MDGSYSPHRLYRYTKVKIKKDKIVRPIAPSFCTESNIPVKIYL